MTFITAISEKVLLLFLPVFGCEFALLIVTIEFIDWKYSFFTLFRIERTFKLELDFLELCQLKGFRATEWTLVAIVLDTIDTLEAEDLTTSAVASIGLFSYIVAYCTLILRCFLCKFDKFFWLVSTHPI